MTHIIQGHYSIVEFDFMLIFHSAERCPEVGDMVASGTVDDALRRIDFEGYARCVAIEFEGQTPRQKVWKAYVKKCF